MKKKIRYIVFIIIKSFVKLFYPKTKFYGAEKLGDEPMIFVGNHAQMNGPIVCELYFPVKRLTWCAGEMMELRSVPSYAYNDFWSQKPKAQRPFFKLLSYIIAPLSVCIFRSAETIGVYRDTRIISTFKNTVSALEGGNSVVIFPEKDEYKNNIVCEFQDRFVDVAKLYYKRNEKELLFVPFYVAPALRSAHIGKAIRFDSNRPIEEERVRICNYLEEEITRIAKELPEHTVVPYRNIPKKDYPKNK